MLFLAALENILRTLDYKVNEQGISAANEAYNKEI